MTLIRLLPDICLSKVNSWMYEKLYSETDMAFPFWVRIVVDIIVSVIGSVAEM